MALQEEFEMQGNWLFRYRSYLPIIVLLIGLAIYLNNQFTPGHYLVEEKPYKLYYNIFALLVGILGLIVRIFTVGYTPKNTSGRNTKEGQVADSLNKQGIYSLVRHPLYLGNFLMWLSPALLTADLWFIVAFGLFYWVYYERIMYAEEQFLRKKFGDEYLEWSKDTPAFIPKMKGFQKADLTFSWKKVLKKEKNGFFALFLIFCLFDVLGQVAQGKTDFNYFLIYMCAISGLVYIVLKFLKSKTNVLNEANR